MHTISFYVHQNRHRPVYRVLRGKTRQTTSNSSQFLHHIPGNCRPTHRIVVHAGLDDVHVDWLLASLADLVGRRDTF